MHRESNFSGILGETAALLAEAFVYVLALVVVLAGLSTAGQIGGAIDSEQIWGFGFTFETDTTAWGLMAALVAIVVQFVGCYFVLARMLELRGRLVAEGTRIWPYVGLSILTGIGTLLGFVALILPGVILMVRWSAAPGFLIGSGTGVTEAMSKSWDATRGIAGRYSSPGWCWSPDCRLQPSHSARSRNWARWARFWRLPSAV